MSVKVISSFSVLMQLASALGKAKLSGNQELIDAAQKAHDSYLEICKQSDEMRY